MKVKKKQRKYSKLREWLMRLLGVHSPHDEWVNIYDLASKYDIPSLCVYRYRHGIKESKKVSGCIYHLPVCRKCRKCPAWSESQCNAEIGKLVAQGVSDVLTEVLSTDLETAKKQMQELSADIAVKIANEEERSNE